MKFFPFYRQLDAMDCGPACLRMVAKHYGVGASLEYLRTKTEYSKQGASLLGLANAAEALGFHTVGARLSFEELIYHVSLPWYIPLSQIILLIPSALKPGYQPLFTTPRGGGGGDNLSSSF
jgi:ATP-binding cassette subfamily B protein